jgi:hypothetical protein
MYRLGNTRECRSLACPSSRYVNIAKLGSARRSRGWAGRRADRATSSDSGHNRAR